MPDKTTGVRHRATKIGEVVSRAGNKTIVVKVTRRVQHLLYKRYISISKKFHAHDEQNQCRVGDWVRIAESRPLSHLKRWRLQEILRQAPTGETAGPVSGVSAVEERQP